MFNKHLPKMEGQALTLNKWRDSYRLGNAIGAFCGLIFFGAFRGASPEIGAFGGEVHGFYCEFLHYIANRIFSK